MSSKSPMSGYYALRWEVLERDSFTCQYCGQHAPNVALEVDHKIPAEDGGEDTLENLTTSCYSCNRGRSGLSIRLKRTGKGRLSPLPYTAKTPYEPDAFRRDEAIAVIQLHPEGIRAEQLAKELNVSRGNACILIYRLNKKGLITKKERGAYILNNI